MKKILLIGLCMILLAIPFVSADLTTDLVSYYKFDGNANDAYGSNHGSVTGATNHLDYGKINQGYDFDGSNDYIGMGDVFAFERTDSFSFSVWFYGDDIGCIIDKQDLTNDYRGYDLRISEDGVVHVWIINSWGNWIGVNTTESVDSSAWNHIIMTYNGNSLASGIEIYHNNVSLTKNVIDDTLSGTIVHNTPFQVGNRDSSAEAYYLFDGYIDEVAIWDRALSGPEISELYNSGAGYQYPFEETGNFIVFAQGTNGEGSLSNFNVSIEGDDNYTTEGSYIVTDILDNSTSLWNVTVSKTGYSDVTYTNWNVSSDLTANLSVLFVVTALDNYTKYGYLQTNISDFNVSIEGDTDYVGTGLNVTTNIPWNSESLWNITLSHSDYSNVTYENYNVSTDLVGYMYQIITNFTITVINSLNDNPLEDVNVTLSNGAWEQSYLTNVSGEVAPSFDEGIYNISFVYNNNSGSLLNYNISEDGNNLTYGLNVSIVLNLQFHESGYLSSLLDDINVTIQVYGETSFENTTDNGTLSFILVVPSSYSFLYSADGYRQNQYLIDLTNETNSDLRLYLINETDSSSILLEVEDVFGDPVEGVEITVQRYIDGFWLPEQILKTNSQGRTEGSFVLSTVYYSFLLMKDDVVYFGTANTDSGATLIFAEDLTGKTFVINLLTAGEYLDYYTTFGIDHSLTFTNTSNTSGYFMFDFNDELNGPWTACLEVVEISFSLGNTVICSCDSTEVVSESGTLFCEVDTESQKTYSAKAFVNNNFMISSLTKVFGEDARVDFGVTGVIMAFLIVLVVFFSFLKTPAVAVVLGSFAFVMLIMVGVIFSNASFVGAMFIIVLALFLAFKWRNRTNGT